MKQCIPSSFNKQNLPGRHFWGLLESNRKLIQSHRKLVLPSLQLALWSAVSFPNRDLSPRVLPSPEILKSLVGGRDAEQTLMNYRECGFSVGRMLPDPGIGRAHILRTQTPVTSCHSDPEAWISPTWAKGRCGGSTHREWAQTATSACSSSQLHRLSILCFGVERGQNRNAGNDSGDRQPWSESSFHFLLAGSSWESNLTSLL